jgi:hypothetical protein
MAARGWGGNARNVREASQFGRGVRAPVKQYRQHVGAARVAHQCRYRGYVDSYRHKLTIAWSTPATVRPRPKLRNSVSGYSRAAGFVIKSDSHRTRLDPREKNPDGF